MMKDMSMKKLLDILSYDQNIIKVNQAKAELLRRHEALEKELESWRGSRDGVLQHIDEMSYEIESLKCCGNCEVEYTLDCLMWKAFRENNDAGYPAPSSYCSHWKSDGMTRKERERELLLKVAIR